MRLNDNQRHCVPLLTHRSCGQCKKKMGWNICANVNSNLDLMYCCVDLL